MYIPELTDLNKLDIFLDELTAVSGKDVRGMFTDREEQIIKNKFGGGFDKKVTPTPTSIGQTVSIVVVDAKCGSKRNACERGDASDGAVADTETDYKWRCFGLEGGKDVDCSLKKSISRSCLDSKTTLYCAGGVCATKSCISGKVCVDGGCVTKPASGKKPTIGQACGSFGVCIKTTKITKNGDKCTSSVNGGIGKIKVGLCSGNNYVRCCEVK